MDTNIVNTGNVSVAIPVGQKTSFRYLITVLSRSKTSCGDLFKMSKREFF